jgi:hypothetical protein
MRAPFASAVLAAALLVPVVASAQETCRERAANRAAGTAVGAVAGALLGGAVAGRHDRAAGAIVGGVAGGLVGNQLAKGPPDCAHAYGWYDNDGVWHANNVGPGVAYGYYDRNGGWVEGAPPEYPAQPSPAAYGAGAYGAGAYGASNRAWTGYPEFRSWEYRIRTNIEADVANDLIAPDDARDLMHQLGDIEVKEAAEFRAHGWDLPYDDRQRIQYSFEQLDRSVDQISEQP